MDDIIDKYAAYSDIRYGDLSEGIVDSIIDKIKDNYKSIINNFKKRLLYIKKKISFLPEYKKAVSSIKSISSKYSKLLKKQIAKKNENKFLIVMKLFMKEIVNHLSIILKSVGLSVALLFTVFFINTSVFYLFYYTFEFDGIVSWFITAIFCAPLTEETAKRISIKKNIDYVYMPIFTWTEFFLYVSRMVVSPLYDGSLLIMGILGRLLGVVLHYGTYTYQKLSLKKDPKESESYWISLMIHSLWNTISGIPIAMSLLLYKLYEVGVSDYDKKISIISKKKLKPAYNTA